MTSFPSMGRAGDERGGASKLVSVKAVSAGYPLRGQLRIAPAPGAPDRAATGVPERGTVWVDPGLLDALGLRMNDVLLLGDAQLRIAQVIALEPDRGAGFMSFSPRVMLHEADLAATALIQPASRVTYRLAVASSDGNGAGSPPAMRRCASTSIMSTSASRTRSCAACVSSRSNRAAPKCARRSTAPRSS